MDDAQLQEAVDGARAYETLHVPALFAEWPPGVLDRTEVSKGHRLLDVACGTGVLAREAMRRVGPDGSVVGVDPNRGMLTVAQELESGVEWRLGSASELPCVDSEFDRVTCQFGMMFFPDRMLAVREMLRVLSTGGALGIAVWDSLERSPAYTREVQLLDAMAGPDAAAALRAPFVMGNRAELEDLVDRAGAARVEGVTVMGRADFPSVRSMVEADLRGWLPVMGVHLDEALIESILAEAEDALADHVTPEGRVVFDSPAHIVTGWKP